MPMDFPSLVYTPAYSVFSRPVTITPLNSQPGQPAYTARGIYGTQPVDVLTENQNVLSDHVTILDILEKDFSVLPVQGDHINIPACLGSTNLGDFEVLDATTNGGGETTLQIRKLVAAKP